VAPKAPRGLKLPRLVSAGVFLVAGADGLDLAVLALVFLGCAVLLRGIRSCLVR